MQLLRRPQVLLSTLPLPLPLLLFLLQLWQLRLLLLPQVLLSTLPLPLSRSQLLSLPLLLHLRYRRAPRVGPCKPRLHLHPLLLLHLLLSQRLPLPSLLHQLLSLPLLLHEPLPLPFLPRQLLALVLLRLQLPPLPLLLPLGRPSQSHALRPRGVALPPAACSPPSQAPRWQSVPLPLAA